MAIRANITVIFNATVYPYLLLSCSLSSRSLIAALWFRLPPSFGPLSTSSAALAPLATGFAFVAGRLRCCRCIMASMNSRWNSSAILSSAPSPSILGPASAGVSAGMS
jgi:hypothetical protein